MRIDDLQEKHIQEWVKEKIDDGSFYGSIEGAEEVFGYTAVEDNQELMPTFPVDYIVRNRSVMAARHVLSNLDATRIISATESISLDDRMLFPDLLIHNPGTQTLIIVEIKKSRQTERQALTELLAYEHEVRNHLPFLSDLNLCYVLVSTEFSTLLDHSISSLIAWESKQVLCLKLDAAEIGSRSWSLRAHLPASWSAIGQYGIPQGGLITSALRLTRKEDAPIGEAGDLEARLRAAFGFIAREGDRTGSHGFALLCRDCRTPDSTEWRLTLGAVNPFAFLPFAHRQGFALRAGGKLAEYIAQCAVADPLPAVACHQLALTKKMIRSLDDVFDFTPAETTDWLGERQRLRQGFAPVKIDFWGGVGDFIRDFAANPSARQHFMPELRRGGVDWTNPLVGIPWLDELAGLGSFVNGDFGYEAVLRFGITAGAAVTLGNMLSTRADAEREELAASLRWSEYEVIVAGREIRSRYAGTADIEVPPPTVPIGLQASDDATPAKLDEFARWFGESFLGEDDELFRLVFWCGYDLCGYFDQRLPQAIPAADRARIEAGIASVSKRVLETAVAAHATGNGGSENREGFLCKFRNVLLNGGWVPPVSSDLSEFVDDVEDENLVRHFTSTIVVLADLMLPSVFHYLHPQTSAGVDWSWIKSQILERRRAGGEYVGVAIKCNGTYVIQNIASPRADVTDPERQVLLQIEQPGYSLIAVVTWEDVLSGRCLRLWEKFRPALRRGGS